LQGVLKIIAYSIKFCLSKLSKYGMIGLKEVMQLFNLFKECKNFALKVFSFKKSIEEQIIEDDAYLTMSMEEIQQLSDEQLYQAIFVITDAKIYEYEDVIKGINSLTKASKNFYIASNYEMEVDNGGLCQFFINSSSNVVLMLSDCLAEIGATEHKELFDKFIKNNNIDLSNLTSFNIDDENDYEAQTKRYPFDEFDEALFALKPIEEYLIDYIKNNKEKF